MAMVTIRFWAALKAAAGTAQFTTQADDLAEALDAARAEYGEMSQFAKVLRLCSVVVDEIPVSLADHREIQLADGTVIDLLPPFAGG